uniref:Uncharacterized protein n=1 Tax=Mus musculus TaxID=10090 RepID=Q3TUR3_MOUSE|nr:unnamed protein product [Mus musculus]
MEKLESEVFWLLASQMRRDQQIVKTGCLGAGGLSLFSFFFFSFLCSQGDSLVNLFCILTGRNKRSFLSS